MRTLRYGFMALCGTALLLPFTASAIPGWTLLYPTGPADLNVVRSAPSAVYDPISNSMIVFGGFVCCRSGYQNDVAVLTHANGLGGTPAWTTLIPNGDPGAPSPRDWHSAVYDAATNRMIIFGGCCYLNDVWVLTDANGASGTPAWIQLTPAGTLPQGRWSHAAVYDVAQNRMIVFGGSAGNTAFSDVWVLTNANGLGGTPTWVQLSPTGGPPAGKLLVSAVYDGANNIMTVFAGENAAFHDTNAVWTLSHANGLGGTPRWTNLILEGAPGSPGRRDNSAAVYDPTNNRMMIFGGNCCTSTGFPMANDAWVLVHANGLGGTPTWNKLTPTGVKPDRRTAHTGVYDVASNRMIIYGGASFDGIFGSAWILTDANDL